MIVKINVKEPNGTEINIEITHAESESEIAGVRQIINDRCRDREAEVITKAEHNFDQLVENIENDENLDDDLRKIAVNALTASNGISARPYIAERIENNIISDYATLAVGYLSYLRSAELIKDKTEQTIRQVDIDFIKSLGDRQAMSRIRQHKAYRDFDKAEISDALRILRSFTS